MKKQLIVILIVFILACSTICAAATNEWTPMNTTSNSDSTNVLVNQFATALNNAINTNKVNADKIADLQGTLDTTLRLVERLQKQLIETQAQYQVANEKIAQFQYTAEIIAKQFTLTQTDLIERQTKQEQNTLDKLKPQQIELQKTIDSKNTSFEKQLAQVTLIATTEQTKNQELTKNIISLQTEIAELNKKFKNTDDVNKENIAVINNKITASVKQKTDNPDMSAKIDAMNNQIMELKRQLRTYSRWDSDDSVNLSTNDMKNTDFSYTTTGNTMLKPTLIFDDGKKTYIKTYVPVTGEQPVLQVLKNNEYVTKDYDVNQGCMVYEGIFNKAQISYQGNIITIIHNKN
ncbi:MAG: TrbG/VirB9 family P-type conjugative transfer protein [Patescibacteria group bacterium]|jgi:hypothetical protein